MTAHEKGPAIGRTQCVVFDCPEPAPLAEFYRSLLGGEVNKPDPRWAVSSAFATLHSQNGGIFAFQQVEQYVAPRWPDPVRPQQIHLDVEVADLDAAEDRVTALGAVLLHADDRGWRVFADPAGHPFCLLRGHP